MEDYEEFLKHHYSHLRDNETRQSSQSVISCSHDTSLIRFYGRPILPPLLSDSQREEMMNHRDAAQRTYGQRKSKTDKRTAYIQSILHSVQLRKAPTMEEFFHEETNHTTADIAHSQSTNNVFTPQDDGAIETKDSFMLCPPSGLIQENQRSVDIPALPSTLCDAFSTQDLTPSELHQECFPGYKCEEKLVYLPITEPYTDTTHPSLSSGYVTYENVENCSTIDEGNNPSNFFIHNTSNTITKMPDIINHPPIDGEELEKSFEVSFIFERFNDDSSRKDAGITSPQQNHVLSPHSGVFVTSFNDETTALPIAQSELSHVGGAQDGEKSFSSPVKESSVQEQSQIGNDETISSIENGLSVSLEPLETTLTSPAASTASQPEILNQAKDIELVQSTAGWAESASPPEEPYRMSLQALLKKSQEYRRRQQQLRNQAKNAKAQERAQREQLSKTDEESGLSDKENDEFPHTRKTTIEGRRNRERRQVTMAAQIQHSSSPMQRSSKQACKDEETKKSMRKEIHVKEHMKDKFESESTHLSGDGCGQSHVLNDGEEDLVSKANQLDCSPEVGIQNKQVVSFSKPLPVTSADSSPGSEAFYLTRDQGITSELFRPCSLERGKFQTVPALQFCMSPIRCKSKGNVKGVDGGVSTPMMKLLADMPLNVDNNIETEVNQGPVNKQDPCISPIMTPMDGGDEAKVLATYSDQSEQIEQLELNLSSLKVLISDLESTLRKSHSQDNISNDSYDPCHKIIQHTSQANEVQHSQAGQDDFGYWVDQQSDDDDVNRNGSVQGPMDTEGQRRESLDSYTNMYADVGPEPSLNDPKDPSVLELEKSHGVVNVGGVLLAKTSAMEQEVVEGRDRGGLSVLGVAPCKVQWSDGTSGMKDLDIISCGKYESSKRQPSTGCISSFTQKMRVLDVFRKVPTGTKIPHKASVLSDTSNQPKERRNEVLVEGEESFHSLNQSYDVDAPSGLWLREGSELDLSSKEQGKHLTPENEVGGQGGASKVKRRLLMHTTEDNGQGKSSPGGGARLVVGPQSNTPTASLQKHGVIACLGNKQQQHQLRLAHAAQVKALKDQQMKQQQEVLQALVERYHLLQSLSFPCHTSSSRLGDEATSPMVPSPASSQPSSSLPECYRPLLAAAVKGFLTRRLMRTDRVAQLLRTIKDTQQFLQVFQVPTPSRGESTSKQDLLLLKRVTMQLRSARYDVHDIFFSLSAADRMQLISWDRELIKERELKRQSGEIGHHKGKSSLSAATQKALERKKGVMDQRKAAVKQRAVTGQTASKAALKAPPPAEEPAETKRGQFKANPRRVPKTTQSCRPR